MTEYDVKYYMIAPNGQVNFAFEHTKTVEADNYAQAMHKVTLELMTQYDIGNFVVTKANVIKNDIGFQWYADEVDTL